MTGYVETILTISPYDRDVADLLTAFLADNGYETFQDTEEGIKGYIKETLYNNTAVDTVIASLPIRTSRVSYTNNRIPCEDWNRRWIEESFTPVTIRKECVIHSPYHSVDSGIKYDIVIAPVMAFGSGHHQTTCMMAEHLLNDFKQGQSLLDMGCGTGILAILASKLGARKVTAIDIDEMAYENCLENIRLNNAQNIEVLLGDSNAIGERRFDTIVANINRNILIADMPLYSAALNTDGTLYISGFYTSDTDMLKEAAARCGLEFEKSETKEEWASVKLRKP